MAVNVAELIATLRLNAEGFAAGAKQAVVSLQQVETATRNVPRLRLDAEGFLTGAKQAAASLEPVATAATHASASLTQIEAAGIRAGVGVAGVGTKGTQAMQALASASTAAAASVERVNAQIAASRAWGAQQAASVARPAPTAPPDDMAAALRRWETSADRVTASTGRMGDSMMAGRQKASALGIQIAHLAGVSAGGSQAMRALATAGQLAAVSFAALGPAVAAALVGIAAFQVGQMISDYIELGESLESYKARMKAAADAERDFAASRKALVAIVREHTEATNMNNAAARATQQRASGDELGAIETQRAALLENIAAAEALAKLRLTEAQAHARYSGDQMQREKEMHDLVLRFASERRRVNAEAYDESGKADRERFDRERDGERMILDAIHARKAAEREATVSKLQMQGQIAAALLASREKSIADVEAAAAKEREAWQKLLETRKIDQAQFDALTIAQAGTTSAKISSIFQQTSVAWRQMVGAGSTLPSLATFSQLMTDLETKRVAMLEAAARWRQVATAPPPPAPNLGLGTRQPIPELMGTRQPAPTGSGIMESLAQAKAIQDAWLESRNAVNAYNAEVAKVNAEASKPAIGAIALAADAIKTDAEKAASAIIGLRTMGVSESDLFVEEKKHTADLRARIDALKTSAQDVPGAIRLIEDATNEITFNGLSNMATKEFQAISASAATEGAKVSIAFGGIDASAAKTVTAVNGLGTALGTGLPTETQKAITSLSLFGEWLVYIERKLYDVKKASAAAAV